MIFFLPEILARSTLPLITVNSNSVTVQVPPGKGAGNEGMATETIALMKLDGVTGRRG